MRAIPRAEWSASDAEAWSRIEAHAFERPGQSLDFTRRLARDMGWGLDHARGAILEYRRFCFLAVTGPEPVTPSEEVDAVWHLHLTYSRDYWEAWCGHALAAPLHHDPTQGGPAEQARFHGQYARTLARYEAWFGPPDPLFWPGVAARFRAAPRYRIVDADRAFVIGRPRLAAVRWVAAAALALAPGSARAAVPLNPLDWNGPSFLTLYAILGVLCALVCVRARDWRREGARREPMGELGLIDVAYLAGGPARVADVVAMALMTAGAAAIDGKGRITMRDAHVALPREIEPFRGCAAEATGRDGFIRAVKGRLGGVRDRLAARSLAPDERQRVAARDVAITLFGALVCLGIAKIVVGHSRGKPVGLLVVMVAVAVVVGIVTATKPLLRTRAGDAALAGLRQRHERAARAPLESEMPFAFALAGAAALSGAAYADHRRYLQASGGGDDGSGGGDGGGGDGGCGGGCGGCGGGD